MPTAELTAKQTRFVHEYLVDGNGSAAAVRAGYSPISAKVAASRLMTKDNAVRRAVEAQQRTDAARLALRRQDVLAGLLEAVNLARAQSNPMAMLSGLRELGKMLGFYAAAEVKVNLNGSTGAVIDRMNRLSDAELMEIIEAGASTAA